MVQKLLHFSLRIFLSSSVRLLRIPFSIERLSHVRVIEFSRPRAGANIHPMFECAANCGGLMIAPAGPGHGAPVCLRRFLYENSVSRRVTGDLMPGVQAEKLS